MNSQTDQPCFSQNISRNPLFDVIKAVMMLWVVWGHFSRWGVVAGPLEPAPYMANVKIAVNMPVFFIIGGYLALSTFQSGSWAKIFARVVGFLWSMASFGLVFALVLLSYRGWQGWRWLVCFPVKQVLYGHWFLRTFAAIYLLSAIVYSLFKTDGRRSIAFSILYIILLFWPTRLRGVLFWLGRAPTIHMLPFFVAGLLLFRRFPLWKFSRTALFCTLFFLAIVLLVPDFDSSGLNFWKASVHWRTVFSSGWNMAALACRLALGLSGAVTVLWCVDRFLCRFPQLSVFSTFGTATLGVYVLHEWPLIEIGKASVPYLPLPCWTRWPLAIIWFLICHFIIVGIRKVHALRLFFFGDELMLRRVLEQVFVFRNNVNSLTQ